MSKERPAGDGSQMETVGALGSTMKELREYTLGSLRESRKDVHPVAGLVHDRRVRQQMMFAAEVYEPLTSDMPRSYWDTEHAQRRLRKYASEAVTRAVNRGNVSLAEYVIGWQDYDSDISNLHDLMQLENFLLYKERCLMVYIAARQGRGKTDLAHLMSEVIVHRSERNDDLATAEIVTNIPSSGFRCINEFEEFETWMTTGDSSENRWFIFDEASSELTGYSHDRQKVEQLLSGMVKRMRKHGVNLIIIGHTGMDLHADLRRLCYFVTKPSLKTARFYATVKRGEPSGHLFDLDRIPATRLGFDTEDEATWSWGDAVEGDEAPVGFTDDEVRRLLAQRAAMLVEGTDISQTEAAKKVSDDRWRVTQSMVSRAGRGEYDAEGQVVV